jgi:flagellar hook assembly protein FlgD
MPKNKSEPQQNNRDDVLVRVDKETAEMIEKLSKEMHSSIRETTRWITWLARKSLGRIVKIEDGKSTLQIALDEFNKLTDLEPTDVSKTDRKKQGK